MKSCSILTGPAARTLQTCPLPRREYRRLVSRYRWQAQEVVRMRVTRFDLLTIQRSSEACCLLLCRQRLVRMMADSHTRAPQTLQRLQVTTCRKAVFTNGGEEAEASRLLRQCSVTVLLTFFSHSHTFAALANQTPPKSALSLLQQDSRPKPP